MLSLLLQIYIYTCWFWPFIFVFNLINAIKETEEPLKLSQKDSAIWAGVALMMLTAVPSILYFFGQ